MYHDKPKNKTDFCGSVNNTCSKTLLKEKHLVHWYMWKKQKQHAPKKLKKKHVVKCKKSTGACKQQKTPRIVDAAMSKSHCISDINFLESKLNIY